MGQPDEAYEHFMLAARADLFDIRGNAGDGIHAASAGGLWQAAVFGFAGLRLTDDGYTLTPQLPTHWHRLAFKFYQHGRPQVVDIHSKGGDA
jgi:kojibiose phosphorylase